jgi:hypothetical protein
VDGTRRFRSVLGRARGDHHLRPGRRLLPGGHESGALRTREGPRHLLGRLTAVVAENPRGEGRTANPAGADARRGALSWLPRGYPRAAAARAPEDHLDRVTPSIYPHSLCDPWTLFAPSPLYSRFEPERADTNLRSPSRSAWVIDRLLKNQNPLEERNNLGSSSPHLVAGRRPENRAAILRSEIHGLGRPIAVPDRCSVRAFDDSTARRSAAAVSRGPRPDASRAGWRLRQSHYRLQRSFQPGMTPVPIMLFRPQNRGAVIQALPRGRLKRK